MQSFLLLLVFMVPGLFAREVGEVSKLQGKVWRENKSLSKRVKLSETAKVYANDVIFTEERSFVKILMSDDSIFYIGPKSSLEIREFEFDSAAAKRKNSSYQFNKGSFRAQFTKGEERNIKISTPTAAMGVRGTEILAEVFEQTEKMGSEVVLLTGEIEFSFKDSSQTLLLQPGQFASTFKKLEAQAIPESYSTLFKRNAQIGGALFMNDITRQIKYNIKNDINIGESFRKLKQTEKALDSLGAGKEDGVGTEEMIQSFGDLMELTTELKDEKTLAPASIRHDIINKGLRYDSAAAIDTTQNIKHVPTSQIGKSIKVDRKEMRGVQKLPRNGDSYPSKVLAPPPPTDAGLTTDNVKVKNPIKLDPKLPPPPTASPVPSKPFPTSRPSPKPSGSL